MTIVSALVEASREMAPLVADKQADKGKYKFKYASLQAILDVVKPVLLKHGVLLVQDVGGDPLSVCTRLMSDEESINTQPLCLHWDGETASLPGLVTTARRVQLLAMLGLVVEDDVPQAHQDNRPAQTRVEKLRPVVAQRTTTLAELQKAAQRGSQDYQAKAWGGNMLDQIQKIRDHDSSEAYEMPTQPAEGKQTSMYHYLLSLIDRQLGEQGAELTLSYLFGRVINLDTPPKHTHRFLVDELRNTPGVWQDILRAAYTMAKA